LDIPVDRSEALLQSAVADSGVQSVLSTPLRDHQGAVCGIVSVHYPQRHARVGDAVLAGLQQLADECGRWLHWHDAAAMPRAVAAVHTAAARVDDGPGAPRYKPDRPSPIVRAGQVLMDRYDLDPATAAEVLMRLANRRGVSIGVMVEQLLD
jgi:GAF domain-containing protein